MGFQTQIRSAAGYILKYILKSFKNLIDGKEIDYLQAWYVHNKIPRIITTHTLVSQEIYHKASMMESDWYYLTDIKLNDGLVSDRLNNYFKFDDGAGRTIVGDNGLFVLQNNGKIISTYGSKQKHIKKIRLRSLNFSKHKYSSYLNIPPASFNIMAIYEIWTPPREYSFYISKSFDDGTFFVYGNNEDFFIDAGVTFDFGIEDEKLLPIAKMTDFSLYNEYNDFDFDLKASVRYAMIHNELIDRGLILSEYKRVNEYSSMDFALLDTPKEFKYIPNMKDDEVLKEFKELNYLDDEDRYTELARELVKRDLL